MASKVMPPDETANYAFQHKIILTYANRNEVVVEPWTPGQKLPMNFKRSVYKHGLDLAQRMREGEAKLCPARGLHRHSWYYAEGRYLCNLCQKLDKEVRTT